MCYYTSSLLVFNHIVVRYLGLISHLNFFSFILQSLGCSYVSLWQINEAFSTCYFLPTKVFICSGQVTSQSWFDKLNGLSSLCDRPGSNGSVLSAHSASAFGLHQGKQLSRHQPRFSELLLYGCLLTCTFSQAGHL